MVFKGLIAAASAVALSVAPTVAAAQTAAPTVADQSIAVAPAGEDVEGSELRGGFIIPLVAIILILLGACIATKICGEDNDLRVSP